MGQKITAFQKFYLGFAVVVVVMIVAMITAFDGKKEKKVDRAQDDELTNIKLQRIAKESVLANLKDPNSAQFRNQKGFCGEVNAKNSFGGYAGFVRFIAAKKDLVFMENDPALASGAFQEAWDRFCK